MWAGTWFRLTSDAPTSSSARVATTFRRRCATQPLHLQLSGAAADSASTKARVMQDVVGSEPHTNTSSIMQSAVKYAMMSISSCAAADSPAQDNAQIPANSCRAWDREATSSSAMRPIFLTAFTACLSLWRWSTPVATESMASSSSSLNSPSVPWPPPPSLATMAPARSWLILNRCKNWTADGGDFPTAVFPWVDTT